LHACRYKWGRGCNVKVWFPECPLFGGKNMLHKRFGTKDSVRCSEFGGGRFSEVANVLQVWDFQSMTRTLSALGSVSASWSVRSGRFYCIVRVMELSASITRTCALRMICTTYIRMYKCMNVPTPPALCLGIPVPRQKPARPLTFRSTPELSWQPFSIG